MVMDDYPSVDGVEFEAGLPVVDREQLEMLLMADEGEDARALIAEIFDIFKTEGVEKLSELEAVCDSNRQAELRTMIHFVAGSAGNLGLMRLNGFYRGIEAAIDEGLLASTHGFAPAIRREFEVACVAYAKELM